MAFGGIEPDLLLIAGPNRDLLIAAVIAVAEKQSRRIG
jgi:hypothetical protein